MSAGARLTQAKFGMLSAFPMNDQHNLPRRLIDVDDDVVDQGARQLLARAHADADVLPCGLEVLGNASMPRGRKPAGEQALSNAERQARYRANRVAAPVEVITRPRRPADRRSRPQRWRDAVKELLDLQAIYADWLATLPEGLRASRTAEVLEAIADLDLTDLAECEPPADMARTSRKADRAGGDGLTQISTT